MRWNWLIVTVQVICLAESASETRGVLQLSLKRAVELATSSEGNAWIRLTAQSVKQAESRSVQAKAPLLPNFDVSLAGENATRSLAALGIPTNLPFFPLPRIAGPLNTFDFRTTATQNILDLGASRRFRASRLAIGAARYELQEVEDRVAADVAKAYVAALRAEARLDAITANIALAEAVLKQAQNQNLAGIGTGIEITRARVQLSNEAHRQSIARNERKRTHLQLLRAIGLGLDTSIELTDALSYVPVETAAPDQALHEALQNRADVKTQHEREATARMSASAAGLERWPSITAFADYGPIGTSLMNWAPTRTYGLSVRFPLFDGGRRSARQVEVESEFAQAHIRGNDLKEQVELEVRLALDSLRSAEEQINVGTDGIMLAEDELAQARRRYEAGVTNSLEVADAQTRLDRARDNYIDALFNHNLAAIELGQATGTIQQTVDRFQRVGRQPLAVPAQPARTAGTEHPEVGIGVLTAAVSGGAESRVTEPPSDAGAGTSDVATDEAIAAPEPTNESTVGGPDDVVAEDSTAHIAPIHARLHPAKVAPTAASAAATTASRYGVQVASFKSRANAERFRQQMVVAEGPVCLVSVSGNLDVWRVMIGPEPTREAADALAKKVSQQIKTRPFTVPLDPTVCAPAK